MIVIKNSQLQSSIILTFGEPLVMSYVKGKRKSKNMIWLMHQGRKRIQSLAVWWGTSTSTS